MYTSIRGNISEVEKRPKSLPGCLEIKCHRLGPEVEEKLVECYTSPSGDSVAMAERNLNGYLSRGSHHTWLRLLWKSGSGPCSCLRG